MKFLVSILLVTFMMLLPAGAQERPAQPANDGPAPSSAKTYAPSEDRQTPNAEGKSPPGEPDLADIIPQASRLSGRLAEIEYKVKGLVDVPALEAKYARIEANLKDPALQLERFKNVRDYRFNALIKLKETVNHQNDLLVETSKPLIQAIRQLGTWRSEWLAEKQSWNRWQSSLVKEQKIVQLKSTFEKANETIETAINLVRPLLGEMLAAQETAGKIHAQLGVLTADVDSLIMAARLGTRPDASTPMFSPQYFAQFGSGQLWYELLAGLEGVTWPGSRFFARQGWIVLLQGFIAFLVIIAVYRNRPVLQGSKDWRFLAARPLAAGLFSAYMATALIYEYQEVQAVWELANMIMAGIAFARLSRILLEDARKRQLVYGLVSIFIVTRVMDLVNVPFPLFRLYTLLAALAGLAFCWRWARENTRHKDAGLYTWLLRLGAVFFAVIVVAELWGKEATAFYLLTSLVGSLATALVLRLFLRMMHGGLEWLFRTVPLRRLAVLHGGDSDALVRRTARLLDAAVWGLVMLPAVLMIWGVYGSFGKALRGVLTLGFNLGSQRISLGLLILAAGILYGAFLASWILQRLFLDAVLARRNVERGVRISIGRLAHYVILLVGFLVAIAALGFEITKITIMLSALGVGIGFGLQGVVNNFVSGLILLFERPVRVGDIIEVGGKWAEITRIGIRATTVQTYDQADVIIPNADLISNQVINWTLSNRLARLIVPVGVAYGSDVPLVMETLMACAAANAKIAKSPGPQVLFLSFGESSLDFELRVWVTDADDRLGVQSELHQEIERRFRAAKIEIAFPQRDVHLRGLDASVMAGPSKATV